MTREFSEEKKHLAVVIEEIDRLKKENQERSLRLKERIRQERERIWEDYARGSANPSGELQDVVQISRTEVNDAEGYEYLQQMIGRLDEQRKSPYFARIDFAENGEQESFYIGKNSLVDPESAEVYVCDWRADISSLFYDFEKGPAYYDTGAGRISGEITLRRQFKIEDSVLKYVFESDLAVEDEILKEELGKSSDLKLKTIVDTIQRDQNRIIRNLSADVLVVDGSAGSGKTSVALHRAAYLLYRFRNTLSGLNILIFSPNTIFNAYIRDVLPELGEERVLQDNFYDFLSGMFDCSFETPGAFYERMLNDEACNELEKRGGKSFCAILESMLKENLDLISFRDISFPGNVAVINAETVRGYYLRFSAYPLKVRCEKVTNILCEDFEDIYKELYLNRFIEELKKDPSVAFTDEEVRIEKAKEWKRCLSAFREDISSLFSVDIFQVYRRALQSLSEKEAEAFDQRLSGGKLDFSDLYPLSYLNLLSGFRPEAKKISHVILDEAQEYPAVLFRSLPLLFPSAKFTILGDLCQRSYSLDSGISEIGDFFNGKKTAFCKLDKTYRCTRQINQYLYDCGGVSPENWFVRDGDEVLFADFDAEELVAYLAEDSRSCAVICRDKAAAEAVYCQIKNKVRAFILNEEGTLSPGKVAVIPSYLAKGLEFDRVALIRQSGFNEKENRPMFYVGASRALHKLAVFDR